MPRWSPSAPTPFEAAGGRKDLHDPLGDVDSPNLYAYAGHNPIDYADPSGMAAIGGSGTPRKATIKEIDDNKHFQGTAWKNFEEGAGAFGEGVRQRLTSTFEFAFNLLWDHKAIPKLAENTWKGAGNAAHTAVSLSRLRGWDEKRGMEPQIREAIVKGAVDFWSTPLYDKLGMSGYVSERIVEQILLTKGAGLVKASMAVNLGLDAVEASPVLSAVLGHVPDPPKRIACSSKLRSTKLSGAPAMRFTSIGQVGRCLRR